MDKRVKVAVVGATGYTGSELLRLMHGHPGIEVVAVVGHGKAGLPVAQVLPTQTGVLGGQVERAEPADIASRADAAFCALPHGASAGIVGELRERGLPVFDLSADFRLQDRDVYARWYGEHGAPGLFGTAVYGLPELYREELKKSDLVAVPGCYPTAGVLALLPLLEQRGTLRLDTLIVDAKSGVSGAGRGLSDSTHFAHVSEGMRAYKVAGQHRHTPEMEQTLSAVAGESVTLTFTPHLAPMTRGILATVYANVNRGDATQFTQWARSYYEASPSVTVMDAGANPDTLFVRGSNRAFISYALDERTGRLVAQCAIDNLVKGASGAAIQCFNLRFGFDEGLGLEAVGLFP